MTTCVYLRNFVCLCVRVYSRWNALHDMAKNDYDYSASELVRGAFVPSAAKQEYGGYFTVPRSTYQLCPNYVDSNGDTSILCEYNRKASILGDSCTKDGPNIFSVKENICRLKERCPSRV